MSPTSRETYLNPTYPHRHQEVRKHGTSHLLLDLDFSYWLEFLRQHAAKEQKKWWLSEKLPTAILDLQYVQSVQGRFSRFKLLFHLATVNKQACEHSGGMCAFLLARPLLMTTLWTLHCFTSALHTATSDLCTPRLG